MNEELFVSQEVALKLKQKGFNKPCMAKWMLDIRGETIPHFRYNYAKDGLWFNHNGKDVSDLNGNDGKDFLWSAPMIQQVVDWFEETHKIFIMPYPRDGWNYLVQRIDESISCAGDSKHGPIVNTKKEILNKAIEEALKLI